MKHERGMLTLAERARRCRTYLTMISEFAMSAVTVREANQGFSELLAQLQHDDEVLITKRGRPVAVLSPYQAPDVTPEREAALASAVALMETGLPWGDALRPHSRDEMHER